VGDGKSTERRKIQVGNEFLVDMSSFQQKLEIVEPFLFPL
jgi:hypothetical protein